MVGGDEGGSPSREPENIWIAWDRAVSVVRSQGCPVEEPLFDVQRLALEIAVYAERQGRSIQELYELRDAISELLDDGGSFRSDALRQRCVEVLRRANAAVDALVTKLHVGRDPRGGEDDKGDPDAPSWPNRAIAYLLRECPKGTEPPSKREIARKIKAPDHTSISRDDEFCKVWEGYRALANQAADERAATLRREQTEANGGREA